MTGGVAFAAPEPPAEPGTRFDLGTRLGRPFVVRPAATGLAAACAAFHPSSPGDDQAAEVFSIGEAPRESAAGFSAVAGAVARGCTGRPTEAEAGGAAEAAGAGALAEAAGACAATGADGAGTLGALGVGAAGLETGLLVLVPVDPRSNLTASTLAPVPLDEDPVVGAGAGAGALEVVADAVAEVVAGLGALIGPVPLLMLDPPDPRAGEGAGATGGGIVGSGGNTVFDWARAAWARASSRRRNHSDSIASKIGSRSSVAGAGGSGSWANSRSTAVGEEVGSNGAACGRSSSDGAWGDMAGGAGGIAWAAGASAGAVDDGAGPDGGKAGPGKPGSCGAAGNLPLEPGPWPAGSCTRGNWPVVAGSCGREPGAAASGRSVAGPGNCGAVSGLGTRGNWPVGAGSFARGNCPAEEGSWILGN